jgi:2,4-dienoyl-CoA reductase-like NADH-dependent reductase (Old Yellow Enzyme family)
MTGVPGFERLLEPIQVGEMRLENRIVLPPMGTNYAAADGSVTARIKDYYEVRAKSGVGLVIVEAAYVHFQGKHFSHELAIDDDRFIPGLKELVQVIRQHGPRVAIQLYHCGREANPDIIGAQPVAPSAVPGLSGKLPRELTTEEIARIVSYYARAADRAKRAGFDGVELHATHESLPAQFLSAASNRRHDDYGGEVENRARFLMEVLRAVREAVGEAYPVWVRLSGREWLYVNKCESLTSQPGLVANILIRKLPRLR